MNRLTIILALVACFAFSPASKEQKKQPPQWVMVKCYSTAQERDAGLNHALAVLATTFGASGYRTEDRNGLYCYEIALVVAPYNP